MNAGQYDDFKNIGKAGWTWESFITKELRSLWKRKGTLYFDENNQWLSFAEYSLFQIFCAIEKLDMWWRSLVSSAVNFITEPYE